MSKKLNIGGIANDLQGSAFFPSKKPAPPSLPQEENIATAQPNQTIAERANDRPDGRPIRRRIIARHSFEVYDDQIDSLRKLSYKEKMEGKLGSMSQMVREAIDTYLKTRKPK